MGCSQLLGFNTPSSTQVQKLKQGDRVISPFTACCMSCFYCKGGATCRRAKHCNSFLSIVFLKKSGIRPIDTSPSGAVTARLVCLVGWRRANWGSGKSALRFMAARLNMFVSPWPMPLSSRWGMRFSLRLAAIRPIIKEGRIFTGHFHEAALPISDTSECERRRGSAAG